MDAKISYTVQKADWLIEGTGVFNDEGWEITKPSTTEIDERTIRSIKCETEEEALVFAKQVVEDRKDDKWLAYVEVKKHTTELVRKLK